MSRVHTRIYEHEVFSREVKHFDYETAEHRRYYLIWSINWYVGINAH